MADQRILIVDDDRMLAETTAEILEEEGFPCGIALSGTDALAMMGKTDFSLGILDIKLPDIPGDDLFPKLRGINPEFEGILVTGFATVDSAMKAAAEPGIISYETKPVNHARLLALIREVFGRKKAQAALRESEQLYRTMFQSSHDGFMLLTDVFIDCNEQLCKSWGYEKKEILGRGPQEFSPEFQPDGRRSDEKALELIRNARRGVPQSFYWQHRKKTGEIIDFEISLNLLPLKGEKVLFCSLREITARLKAEEALKNSEEQLRALSRKMITLSEDERAGLARELHDELGQKLTGLFLEIECLKGRPGGDPAFVETAKSILRTANDDLKRIYHGLRPVAIDKLGLSYAMDTLVREFAAHGNIRVDADIVRVDKKDVDPNLAIAIYRILQEILNNVAKHSGAEEVKVSFVNFDGKYILEVDDDGKGFLPEELEKTGGFGILGMKERAAQFGGILIVKSSPGNGTRVTAEF